MKISRSEECCLAVGIAHCEKGKGVAPGPKELSVRCVGSVAWPGQ